MKRYAVSSTFHMIDRLDLDGTSLEIIEAKNPKAAATQVIMRDLLELDGDCWDCGELDDSEQVFISQGWKLKQIERSIKSKDEYLKLREAYWKKNIKFDTKDAKDYGYTFIFYDVDGRSSGAYGINVIEI